MSHYPADEILEALKESNADHAYAMAFGYVSSFITREQADFILAIINKKND